jgi:uncharacterized protein (DUF58 family)
MRHWLKRFDDSEFRAGFKRALISFAITAFLLGGSFLSIFIALLASQAGEYRTAEILFILSLLFAFGGGIYAVPRLARRVRFEFLKLRISYAPTQETAFFFVITVIVAVAALNTGNNLLYLIGAMLLAVMMTSGIVSEASLRGLDVGFRFPEHIYAGQEVNLDITLANHKRLVPSFSLTVGVDITNAVQPPPARHAARRNGGVAGWFQKRPAPAPAPSGDLTKLAHFVVVPCRERVRQTIPYTFAKRGRYVIRGFSASTKFPFGFIQKTRRIEAAGELIVYPEIERTSDAVSGVNDLAGALDNALKGNGADLYAIRQYQVGDPMRRIDWKATAKAQRMMVREFTREDERRVTIYFDSFLPPDPLAASRPNFENGVRRAAALIRRLIESGALVRLVTPNDVTEFGNTTQNLHDMLRILAVVKLEDAAVAPTEKGAARASNFAAPPATFGEAAVLFTWESSPTARRLPARGGMTVVAFDSLSGAETR